MKFTQEQLDIFAICKNLKNNEKVSIIAPAGSGKTSTLVELAKQLPNKTILYLAYNQSIKKKPKANSQAMLSFLPPTVWHCALKI